MYRKVVSGFLFMSALTVQVASAADVEPTIGAMLTYTQPAAVRDVDSRMPGLQLSADLPWQPLAGWRLQAVASLLQWERLDGRGDDRQYQLGLDMLRPFQPLAGTNPYAVAGLAAAREEVAGEGSIQPTLSLGGGLFWPLLDSALQLRLDLRAQLQHNDYETGGAANSGRTILMDGRFGVGLSWLFAGDSGMCQGAACGETVADADGDGVADSEDLCLESLPSAVVDHTGCEPATLRDSDSDGVLDAQDRCPATPLGSVVDAEGCAGEAAVVLEGVNFEFDSDVLTAEARDVLAPIATLLNGGLSAIRLEIAGHTDDLGGDDYNQALSARRAYAVKDYLAGLGVDPARLVATGYGALRPVADNSTEDGRALNRRVVFRVMD